MTDAVTMADVRAIVEVAVEAALAAERQATNAVLPGIIARALVAERQEIYAELADSFKSAGEMSHYDFQSIEDQCTAHTARGLGDRISWLVES